VKERRDNWRKRRERNGKLMVRGIIFAVFPIICGRQFFLITGLQKNDI